MSLAAVEAKYRFVKITPYEKNMEMWRQLWRVVEKSDILVQVRQLDLFWLRLLMAETPISLGARTSMLMSGRSIRPK